MNEAIENFNRLISGEQSIKVDAKIPDTELFKVGLVLFISYIAAFTLIALLFNRK
jgi:hypothetical protein